MQQLTRDKYIEMKNAGLTDREIAKLFGLQKATVSYKKWKWGLTQQKQDETSTSLCWYCRRSRPSLCEWIANGTKVYEKAEKCIREYNSGPYEVILIRECSLFEPMENRPV